MVFQDSKDHWAKNYIELLNRKGIVKGKGPTTYAPDDLLTRAEFTKIALKAIDVDVEPLDEINQVPFPDVTLDDWFLPYVKKSKELGLVKGYDDGEFKPNQPINRVEAIKILMEAFHLDMTEEVSLRDLPPKHHHLQRCVDRSVVQSVCAFCY
ncbi:S-layer homology domain-containing protein [Candidatus Peregrinibacteria bacterium]|nr:MAG: S-layer homology domain-containing protein [Candidatus Peregrinibacteria bacterium]